MVKWDEVPVGFNCRYCGRYMLNGKTLITHIRNRHFDITIREIAEEQQKLYREVFHYLESHKPLIYDEVPNVA